MKNKFIEDLNTLYSYLDNQQEEYNLLFSYLENNKLDKLSIIDEFYNFLDLNIKLDDELRLALITRLISLRSDSLVQVLKKESYSKEDIEELELKAYEFVKEFWHKNHQKTIEFIESSMLFTPFYREIFAGVHKVGMAFSTWQPKWTKHIIYGINKELSNKFDQNEQKIQEFLEKNNLLDLGHNSEIADRSYSVLENKDDNYQIKTYIEAFKKEVTDVIDLMEDMIDRLLELEDEVYNQKWDYILYFQSIVQALSEDNNNKLVSRWADVDRAWMKIKAPIQVAHPLEYYEDHYRKAVALEWDIRVSNPSSLENNRAKITKNAFIKLYNDISIEQKNIYDLTISSIDKTMLFISRPALFYGAELNGLFSAQVVPNDEIVSNELGKKIFAFSDEILQAARAKPFMLLHKEIFGQEFLQKERSILFGRAEIWHKVYDISTIGHEFGHILWCDTDSESIMNKSGHFKNIEEFKATTGGIVSFLLNEDEKELLEYVVADIIKRAVNLIAWQEVPEVLPYYCEGLIHLKALFDSDILSFDIDTKHLNIKQNSKTMQNLTIWYIEHYKQLATIYLNKTDAWEFLKKYVKKDKEIYLPKEPQIEDFVRYYYSRYQEISAVIDKSDLKSNYIPSN